MIHPGILKAAACAVLVVLAVFDLRLRRLPNAAVNTFAILYFVNAAVTGAAFSSWGIHLAFGGASFVVAALMFRLGLLGGGDVKLAAAIFLWAGPESWPVLVVVSLCGLLVSVAMLVVGGMLRIRALAGASTWLSWLAPARGVPYGVALALGGVVAVLVQPTGEHRAAMAMLQSLV